MAILGQQQTTNCSIDKCHPIRWCIFRPPKHTGSNTYLRRSSLLPASRSILIFLSDLSDYMPRTHGIKTYFLRLSRSLTTLFDGFRLVVCFCFSRSFSSRPIGCVWTFAYRRFPSHTVSSSQLSIGQKQGHLSECDTIEKQYYVSWLCVSIHTHTHIYKYRMKLYVLAR